MGLSHASKKCCPGWGSIHENGVCVGELLGADAAGGVEEIVEDFGVVADEDDVVVADAVAQEVGSRLVEVEAHLGAAHVVVVEVLLEVGGGDNVGVRSTLMATPLSDSKWLRRMKLCVWSMPMVQWAMTTSLL